MCAKTPQKPVLPPPPKAPTSGRRCTESLHEVLDIQRKPRSFCRQCFFHEGEVRGHSSPAPTGRENIGCHQAGTAVGRHGRREGAVGRVRRRWCIKAGKRNSAEYWERRQETPGDADWGQRPFAF